MSPKKETKLPKFLEKFVSQNKSTSKTVTDKSGEKSVLKNIPESTASPQSSHSWQDNPASIGAVFNKDSATVSGVQRVFRKSMIFLILSNLFFVFTTLLSISFFDNILLTVLVSILFIVVTNVFFIVLADRSYLWISLGVQGVLGFMIYAFLGQAISLVTIPIILLIVLFTYFAYSEAEKVQLGSRLFSLSHITKESGRILSTVMMLIVSLGIFNGIMNRGSDDFIENFVFKNDFVADYLFVGKGPTQKWNLNKGFMNEVNPELFGYSSDSDFTPRTFFDFLENLYENPKSNSLLTKEEIEKIEVEFEDDEEDAKILAEELIVATELQQKHYPNISFGLDTKLNGPKFREISKQYYVNKINEFEEQGSGTILELVPRKMILPAFVAMIIFIILLSLKLLINLISFLILSILWKFLHSAGFVKIEIETVEAEVVSI